MTGRDLSNQIFAKQSILPQTVVATVTGEEVDLLGYNSACAVVSIGTEGQTFTTSNYWTITITGCATTGGSFVALTAAMMIEPATNSLVIDDTTDDESVYQMGFNVLGTGYRFFKVVCTESGTISTGTPMEALIIGGDPQSAPTAALTAGH